MKLAAIWYLECQNGDGVWLFASTEGWQRPQI